MTLISEKIFFVFACTVMLIAAGGAAYFSEPLLLSVPVVIIGVLLLLQYPQVLLYLLVAAIPWSVEYNFSPSLATDLPDEPLMLLAAFVALVFLVQIKRNSLLHPLLLIILLHFFWTAFTVATSSNILLSVKFLFAKGWYLLSFLILPVLLFRDTKHIKTTAVVLFLSTTAAVLTALWRYTTSGFEFAEVNDALTPFFKNHVIYSSLLVFMIPVNIAMLQLNEHRKEKAWLIIGLLILLLALYFSYARGGWLALLTGTTGYWLIRKKILFPAFLLVILLCLLSLFYLSENDRYLQYAPDYKTTIFHKDFNEHFHATYKLKDVSTAERFHRWVAGVRMLEDSWMTGLGPSTFYENYKSYTVPAFKTWVSKNEERSTVHNYFLLLLIEQGILSLLLFVVLLGLFFWYAERVYHQAKDKFWKVSTATIAVIMIMQCTVNFFSDLVETDKVGSIFYLCIAFLIITHAKNTTASER